MHTLTPELLDLMRKAGCTCMLFGVESDDPHVSHGETIPRIVILSPLLEFGPVREVSLRLVNEFFVA